MDFKSILNVRTLKKLSSPNASKDLNAFLEKLPDNVGQNVLIAAGIAWASAAALGLITMVKVQELTALRGELREAEAVKPSVPFISESPVSASAVESFTADLKDTYGSSSKNRYPLDVAVKGSKLVISSPTTASFGVFREAVAHVYNGGSNWRVGLEKLCVGRECGENNKKQLSVDLNIKKVSVENPNQ